MTSRVRWFVLLVSTPLVLLVTIGGFIGTPTAAPQQTNQHLKVFEDVIRLTLQAYVEEVDVDKLMDGAMKGLADGLDTSSSFLQPDEVAALDSKAELPAGDVGLVVTRQFYLRVLGVRDGSPAARAGLQSGDYVRMIDNRPTRDMSGITGTRLLRGQPGSKVSLVIIRGGNTTDPRTFDLVREKLAGDVVSTSAVDGVTRIRVSSFGPTTSAALKAAFDKIAPTKGGAVIDLRGTADGTPEDGIKAARLFVKPGSTIAIRAAKAGEPVKTLAEPGDGAVTSPVVLLVSNGTSNAAEVFAAALQGNSRADLVGEPTAGVAARQKLIRLPDGYGLWLTYERYMRIATTATPLPIHERGLAPTVPVQNPAPGFDELPPASDVPLAKAIEHLKKK